MAMRELNQTPPVAVLHSQIVPLAVWNLGVARVGDLKKLAKFCDFLNGQDERFFPSVLNSHATDGCYKLAFDAFMWLFNGYPQPQWLIAVDKDWFA